MIKSNQKHMKNNLIYKLFFSYITISKVESSYIMNFLFPSVPFLLSQNSRKEDLNARSFQRLANRTNTSEHITFFTQTQVPTRHKQHRHFLGIAHSASPPLVPHLLVVWVNV